MTGAGAGVVGAGVEGPAGELEQALNETTIIAQLRPRSRPRTDTSYPF
jgi:hypothetical protein